MRILLTLLFIAALSYSLYVQTTTALILVVVIATIGIIYNLYEMRNKKKAKNI
ncbi:hypothetical protein IHV12_04150 [Fictibacillus sp. 7GRE50]|uniref:hypothetical protein n=1 Tax=Fictibacillus sp. 7GRE50 TaxID=2745878 RepID=UPI0018CEF650|nr:hypothetical protein [Fictibacillus sp. 7GRE50]MBH0164092.1 hypothetical protein [Fictibacillus sp. 7GRE50]